MSLSNLGWDSFFDQQLTDEERRVWSPARVVWEGRGAYRLRARADEWQVKLAGRLRHQTASSADLPKVGDWVLASARTIHRVLNRRSVFSRGAAGRASDEQVVAANVDSVFLVTSFNRDFNLRRLERYLAIAWKSGARPVLVLNKADLCEEPELWRHDLAPCAPDVPVVLASAVRGDGLLELAEIVRHGGTTALLGSSGVGKSSLIDALLGESRQQIRQIRDDDDRGRHSTTSRHLFLVPGGGVLIDTPGMRELQLWDAEDGLERAFVDIEALARQCRFRDCAHATEPGCAVTGAVADGRLDSGRLDSYRRLEREERFVQARADEGVRAERSRHAKLMSKAIRRSNKLKGT